MCILILFKYVILHIPNKNINFVCCANTANPTWKLLSVQKNVTTGPWEYESHTHTRALTCRSWTAPSRLMTRKHIPRPWGTALCAAERLRAGNTQAYRPADTRPASLPQTTWCHPETHGQTSANKHWTTDKGRKNTASESISLITQLLSKINNWNVDLSLIYFVRRM